MPEPKLPAAFEVQKYPDKNTGEDSELFVCTRCVPTWDTFHLSEAERHASEGQHNRIGVSPVRLAGAP